MKKTLLIVVIVAAVSGIAWSLYRQYQKNQALEHPKFYSGNGRLEATEIYVSAKLAGRIDKVFVKEGDLVKVGDKLVQMQTNVLEAQRDATKAQIKVSEGELAMAKATVKQKEAALRGATIEYDRQKQLLAKNATSQQHFDNAETAYKSALANLEYAKANIITAEGQVESQKAELKKIEADIEDSLLVATRDGRIQYLLAHEGEVLAAGGRAMNLVNLTDVYMTFFLPTNVAGLVKIGSEVKLVFDAAPDFPIDAKVTFIDPVAQFTPKSVETQVEREKLMFRVKASIDAKLLAKHIELVKTGLPGVAWVKVDPEAAWKNAPLEVLRTPVAPEPKRQSAAKPAKTESKPAAKPAAKPAKTESKPAAKPAAAKVRK